ncbi:unnamed protein product [Orchesella dallaii]|uniref:Uncharacterized protein n=1 Tax=Orchesella dallaii TaxID=48710 RepID=A0ABP1PTJ7_9HEXA
MKTWLANKESNEPSSIQTIADSESSNTSTKECDDAEEDENPKTPDPYTNDGVKVHQESYEYHQSKSQDEFSCQCGSLLSIRHPFLDIRSRARNQKYRRQNEKAENDFRFLLTYIFFHMSYPFPTLVFWVL